MKRKIILTDDGSSSLFVEDWNEIYHSSHGAIQESSLVYIHYGLEAIKKPEISIYEIGLGTGLNALLTYKYALEKGININYYSIELYPLTEDEYSALNYSELLNLDPHILKDIHASAWDEDVAIHKNFILHKIKGNSTKYNPDFSFDLCFYDAFAPEVQPELWSDAEFIKVYQTMNPKGILTTYSAKGFVRRGLQNAGFKVEKLQGPPGKREVLRATKTVETT